MAILFPLARVLRAVAGLLGRYRLARWIGFCVAVFALILAVGSRANAADGRPVVGPYSSAIESGNSDVASVIVGGAFSLGLALAVWLACGLAVLAVSSAGLALYDRRLHRRHAVRGGDDDRAVRSDLGGAVVPGLHGGRSDGPGVRGQG